MLRPADPHALAQLQRAAFGSDLELDSALMCIGVLAPADLDEIRLLLQRAKVTLRAAANRDGHRIVEVIDGDHRIALVHHDGRIQTLHVAIS